MKLSLVGASLAAMLTLPGVVFAQGQAVSVGVSGGASLPVGNLKDVADVGYSVAGHLYLRPQAVKAFMFRGDVTYDRWNGTGTTSTFNSLGVIANVLFPFSDDNAGIRPYLVGGAGLYRFGSTVKVGTLDVSSSVNKFGVQGGAGLEFKLAGMSTFLEGKYVNVFNDGRSTSYIPVTFGVRF